jgi:osmoprotectant transport system ATP-binding protein
MHRTEGPRVDATPHDDDGHVAMIRLDGVSKRYDDGTVAVHDLDLDVPEGETVVLVGPSGCGKSTTLKMVNRLIEPTAGRILLEGEDVTHGDPVKLRRRMGYVIQQTGLFPHQTIAANVATVPRLLGWDRRKVDARVHELLDMVGLDPATYAKRYPHQLSGGQRQRVGVARALAADPPVLLMDEPFGAVDPIVRLQREMRKTVLFVTHDLDEAVRMGDRIAVFSQGGHLEQYDAPTRLLGSPATDFVASFVGSDRGLKRLSVTTIGPADLEQPPVVHLDDPVADAAASLQAAGARWGVVLDDAESLHGWIAASETGPARVSERARRMEAWVRLGSPLKAAFSEMLQHDAGWVAVLDGDRYVGVLTPATLHEALRRSVESDLTGVDPGTIELDTVSTA